MKISKLFLVLFFLFLAGFFAARFWQLSMTPIVVDEPANIRDIDILLKSPDVKITDFQWDPSQATLFYYPAILLIKMGITDKLLALRYSSMIFSLVALLSFYFLVKKYTDKVFALCATTMLSSSYYFLQFSRVGWSAMSATALGLLLFAILMNNRLSYLVKTLVGGIVAGILFYGYRGGSVFLLGSTLLFLLPNSFFKTNLAKRLLYLFLYLVIFFFISLPWWKQIITNRDRYDMRYNTVSVLRTEKPYHGLSNNKAILTYQTMVSLKSWLLFLPYDGGGVENSRYLPLKYPQISWLLIPFFYLGIILNGKKILDFLPLVFTYLIGIITGQILTVNPPNGARGLVLLPLIYFFISIGLYAIYTKFRSFSLNLTLLLIFTFLINASDIIFYFWWMSWIKIF